MNLQEIYLNNKNSESQLPIISFEVYPSETNDKSIEELSKLKKYNPAIVSVTYRADKNTKSESLEFAKRIKNELGYNIMPHFACINANKEFIKNYIKEIEQENIKNVLALRGDKPTNSQTADFKYAYELIEFIKENTNLSIAVAGYPEGHLEAESLEKDIENLKRKIEKGGQVIYTQLFFNNDYFFKYIDLLEKSGINTPVIPGILPITNYKQVDRMVELCGVDVPLKLKERLEKYKNDKNAILQIGIDFTSYQVEELLNNGIKGLHFYTLNKANPTIQIMENII